MVSANSNYGKKTKDQINKRLNKDDPMVMFSFNPSNIIDLRKVF